MGYRKGESPQTDLDYLRVFHARLGRVFSLSAVCGRRCDLTSWPGPRDRLRRMVLAGWLRPHAAGGRAGYEVTEAGLAALAAQG